MRVAVLTPWSTTDKRSWSGVIPLMVEALSARADLRVIETGRMQDSLVDRGLMKALGLVSQRSYLAGHALATSRKKSSATRTLVMESGADVVLAIAASQEIAASRLQVPVVQVTDATFEAMRNYYPLFENLHPVSSWQARHMARLAHARTSAFAVASAWAKESLVNDYSTDPAKCVVVPFGPAVRPDEPPAKRGNGKLRVLLVASDWFRKGGDLAVAAVDRARRNHPAISLTVVGDAPTLPPWVARFGVANQQDMPALYAGHDVLIELARANAGGVTITDAHAFGLPVIATDTGGVASIVSDGSTGLLVPPTGDVSAAAAQAISFMHDDRRRLQMSELAFARYRDTLNWDHWAEEVLDVCRMAARETGTG